MLAAVPDCQKDAPFLAALGQQLNSQGRYLEATDHLERALMLEPALKDAQLSYAIALTGSGDVLSATALLDDLLADPTLPDTLRPLILRQKTMLSQAPRLPGKGDWQSRFTLATRLGYDSNLLGSPNLSSLALSLSGQTLVLPLDQSYLARGATYSRSDAQLELHRNAADGARWELVGGLRNRYSPQVSEAGSSQVDLLLERSQLTSDRPNRSGPAEPGPADASGSGAIALATSGTPTRSSGSYLNMSGSGLHSRAGTRYRAWGAAGGWAGAWSMAGAATCQARIGAEWQNRSYLDNPVLSGRYTGLTMTWSCEQTSGLQWLVGVKAGRDDAQDPGRAGGNQTQTSVRSAVYLPLARLPWPAMAPVTAGGTASQADLPQGGFLLDLEQSQQADASGYSPIIESGRTRRIIRRAARLEFQRPFSRNVQGVVGIEWVAQSSSLELFRLFSRGVYTGLRVSW